MSVPQEKTPPNDDNLMVCPYLGIRNDATTSLAYPSAYNYCHRTRPIEPANIEHQQSFCLAAAHSQCPVFKSEEGDSPMPEEIRGHGIQPRTKKRKFGMGILIILLVFLAGGVFIGFNSKALALLPFGGRRTSGAGTLPISLATQTGTMNASLTPTLQQTTVIASATPTASNTPSLTPTPRPVLSLDVPLGVGGQFLIHKVLEGDSMSALAKRYGTTVDAIRLANLNLRSPLQPDWFIVIPVGLTDLSGFPAFEVYLVKESIRVDNLAATLSVDATQFAYYNNLSPDYVLLPGDWLLVPRSQNTPSP